MTNKNAKFIVWLVFIIIFIFPNGLVFGAFNAIHNHIFTFILTAIYLLYKIKKNKISKITVLIWIIVFIVSIYTKRFGFIDMMALPIFGEFVKHKESIKKYVLKSYLPYICVIFSIFYTFVYRMLGIGGRGEGKIGSGLLISAIGEINLTGLSIFLLSLIVIKKNKKIGCFVALLGTLTLSRSYLLALMCSFVFCQKFVKRITKKIIKYFSYLNLTIISSLILFGLSLVFINLYLNGNIIEHSSTAGISRIFKLNDYSNYFRFLAIFIIVIIMIEKPKTLLLGFSNEEYLEYGFEITNHLNINFGGGIGTHNLFFSHLKMYGLAVFIEIFLVSKYLKKIVSCNNFGLYISIFLYCIILGSGLNNYWLFLTGITLILHE